MRMRGAASSIRSIASWGSWRAWLWRSARPAEEDVAPLHDLLHHLLQALLELAAVLRAGDESSEVERVDLLVLQQLRNLVGGDARSETLDDGGLADAGLADQHRVVLRAP